MPKSAVILPEPPDATRRRQRLSIRLPILSLLFLRFMFYTGWPQAALRKCRHSVSRLGTSAGTRGLPATPERTAGRYPCRKNTLTRLRALRRSRSPSSRRPSPRERALCSSIQADREARECASLLPNSQISLDMTGTWSASTINMTLPRVACFPSMADANHFPTDTILEKCFTLSSSHISDPSTRTSVEAKLVVQARDYLALMDTAKPRLPHRVGRVVIDGIVDPVGWANEPSHKWAFGDLASTEKTYAYYLQKCSEAGPSRCPIAKRQNEPPSDISARIETLLDALAVSPLPVVGNGVARPGILTSGCARGLLLEYLERPPLWSESALAFAQAMSGNGTLLYNKLTASYSTRAERPQGQHYDLARLAVSCLDSPPPFEDTERSPPPSAEDLAAEFLRTMDHVSPHFGASVSVGEPDGGCHFWPTSGKGPERFTGPWNATLEVPMLIVSNTMDPITPIQSGLLINSLMPHSSRMIIQDGPGHCSTAIATPCTQKLVRDYYAGIVPANGTMCGTEYEFFPGNLQTVNMPPQVPNEEDARVMDSARVVGELLYEIRHS
ncbi:hypothetical protein HMN09_00775100 [Mycena chlorophos]|uniref:Peptidase S33 tripeptidyl aminopeptidase-like C-terminal domain-containing protein n=1 Tax=Mycena chlorophos TaxID=658473 RepID=A0A8H6SU08_MYCCL|nr:hypothetical protein HMN09_00775100 [Mycena chlorophos]